MRTEIYDAIQGVLDAHDLLVTPTLACTAVANATDGNTTGPTQIQGEDVDPLIGWCLTYPLNFTGHPAASIPRIRPRATSRDADRRPTLRRCGRPGRQRGFRAAPAVASELPDSRQSAYLSLENQSRTSG